MQHPTQVNPDISDLFFNTIMDDTVVYDEHGKFSHYDEAKLRDAAQTVLASLSRLGVAVPSVDDLIADYYGRI